jgi:hypothetical protein
MTTIEIGLQWVDHLLANGYPFDGLEKAPTRQVLGFLERMQALMSTMVITTASDAMVKTVQGWTLCYKEAVEGTFVSAEELGKQRTFLACIRDQIAADKTSQQELHRESHARVTGLEPTANPEVTGLPWGKETASEKAARERREHRQNLRIADAARDDAVPLRRDGKRARR